jgi:hypothetical protein
MQCVFLVTYKISGFLYCLVVNPFTTEFFFLKNPPKPAVAVLAQKFWGGPAPGASVPSPPLFLPPLPFHSLPFPSILFPSHPSPLPSLSTPLPSSFPPIPSPLNGGPGV